MSGLTDSFSVAEVSFAIEGFEHCLTIPVVMLLVVVTESLCQQAIVVLINWVLCLISFI